MNSIPPTSILLMMIEEERIAVAADLILLIKVQLFMLLKQLMGKHQLWLLLI
jgi:hypothetical protein